VFVEVLRQEGVVGLGFDEFQARRVHPEVVLCPAEPTRDGLLDEFPTAEREQDGFGVGDGLDGDTDVVDTNRCVVSHYLSSLLRPGIFFAEELLPR